MPTKVIMPSLGESVDEGTITKWLKEEGEKIEEYEPLLEVNTDKVDTEIPSPASGVLLKIIAPEGKTVQSGEVLAWLGERGESVPDGEVPSDAVQELPAAEKAPAKEPEGVQAVADKPISAQAPRPGRDKELGFISPVVAKISQEEGVDLSKVEGTGRGGRITKKDVMAYLERRKVAPEPEPAPEPRPAREPLKPEIPPVEAEPGEMIPLTPMRKSIAEHMVRSKRTAPHVSTVMEADFSRVIEHREMNKETFAKDGVKLTFTAYIVSAVISALKNHPIINASWSDDGILLHREINIGVAASLGQEGLIVPVIRNADRLSLLGIASAINDLAERARTRQLKPDEVQGGTFTITNHGVSGSLFAMPIINQPQAAILGVGAIQKRVVVINDAIAIRPMVYLSLTIDHRILDGATADYYLGDVVDTLENWS